MTLPVSSFSCSVLSTCSGNPIFLTLQREMNRVRPIYGLPADVATDGKLGIMTLAKMIKTAQAISKRLGQDFDADALSDYTYPEIAGNLTTKMMAFDADTLLVSLRRNGYAAGHVPTNVAAQSLIDPYSSPNLFPPLIHSATILNVGPTAIDPPTPVTPTPYFPEFAKIPLGLKIGGGVVLGLGVIGGVIAVAMGIKNR